LCVKSVVCDTGGRREKIERREERM